MKKLASFDLSDDLSVPLQQKINDAIRRKIKAGESQPGEKIPSENQLAAQLGARNPSLPAY